jgi:hypothetical protein
MIITTEVFRLKAEDCKEKWKYGSFCRISRLLGDHAWHQDLLYSRQSVSTMLFESFSLHSKKLQPDYMRSYYNFNHKGEKL